MKICYQVTLEDLVTFGVYHSNHSPAVQRMMKRYLYGVPLFLLILMIFFLLSVISSEDFDKKAFIVQTTLGIFFPIVFSVLWLVIWPKRFEKSLARQYRKIYAEGSASGSVGPVELELTENAFVAINTTAETRLRYDAIEQIVTNGNYTYIFRNAFTAYVIPHEGITSGDLTAFIEALERRISIEPL